MIAAVCAGVEDGTGENWTIVSWNLVQGSDGLPRASLSQRLAGLGNRRGLLQDALSFHLAEQETRVASGDRLGFRDWYHLELNCEDAHSRITS